MHCLGSEVYLHPQIAVEPRLTRRLPADIDEGDWIELGQFGAYGACLRTRFNGFDSTLTVEVADPPMLATPGYEG